MACVLTTGFDLADCNELAGGVKEIRVAKLSDVLSVTQAAGVVTAISMVATKKFWRYRFKKETSDFEENEVISDENGTIFYEQKGNVMLNGLEAVKRNELRLLSQSNLVVIVTLNASEGVPKHILYGLSNGMNAARTSKTGKTYGDFNGYSLAFSGKELSPAPFVQDSILAAITN